MKKPPVIKIREEDLRRVYEPGTCVNPETCPACQQRVNHIPRLGRSPSPGAADRAAAGPGGERGGADVGRGGRTMRQGPARPHHGTQGTTVGPIVGRNRTGRRFAVG
jgi:hypothetical protein